MKHDGPLMLLRAICDSEWRIRRALLIQEDERRRQTPEHQAEQAETRRAWIEGR